MRDPLSGSVMPFYIVFPRLPGNDPAPSVRPGRDSERGVRTKGSSLHKLPRYGQRLSPLYRMTAYSERGVPRTKKPSPIKLPGHGRNLSPLYRITAYSERRVRTKGSSLLKLTRYGRRLSPLYRITAYSERGVPRWRKRWDSNPRAREGYLISSQARYDHFDTLP